MKIIKGNSALSSLPPDFSHFTMIGLEPIMCLKLSIYNYAFENCAQIKHALK